MASVAEVLFGQAAPTEVSFRNKVIGFISLQHAAPTILFLPVILGTMALAGLQFGDPRLLLVIITALLGSFAVNVINDIVDIDRDKWKWPQRPLSSGLIQKSVAALYIILIAAIAVLMAGVPFNWLFATLGLLGGALVYSYAQYARDRIGHLTGAMFFGALFSFYAPLPWPNLLAFLLILSAVTAWTLTQVKHMTEEGRTQETAKKAFMTLAMYVAIY